MNQVGTLARQMTFYDVEHEMPLRILVRFNDNTIQRVPGTTAKTVRNQPLR